MDTSDRAKFIIRKVFLQEEENLAGQYGWIWEHARWHELVIALMLQVVNQPERVIRRLVDELVVLDLVNINELAQDSPGADEYKKRIAELLSEEGVPAPQARSAVELIAEAASGLAGEFGGSVTEYLRRYGQAMLGDVGRYFRFTAADSDSVRRAFVYWLQNTLGMPLSLSGPELQEFCGKHGVTESDVIAAADEIGLNVAVLDDLVHLHLTRETVAAEEPEAESGPRDVAGEGGQAWPGREELAAALRGVN